MQFLHSESPHHIAYRHERKRPRAFTHSQDHKPNLYYKSRNPCSTSIDLSCSFHVGLLLVQEYPCPLRYSNASCIWLKTLYSSSRGTVVDQVRSRAQGAGFPRQMR